MLIASISLEVALSLSCLFSGLKRSRQRGLCNAVEDSVRMCLTKVLKYFCSERSFRRSIRMLLRRSIWSISLLLGESRRVVDSVSGGLLLLRLSSICWPIAFLNLARCSSRVCFFILRSPGEILSSVLRRACLMSGLGYFGSALSGLALARRYFCNSCRKIEWRGANLLRIECEMSPQVSA